MKKVLSIALSLVMAVSVLFGMGIDAFAGVVTLEAIYFTTPEPVVGEYASPFTLVTTTQPSGYGNVSTQIWKESSSNYWGGSYLTSSDTFKSGYYYSFDATKSEDGSWIDYNRATFTSSTKFYINNKYIGTAESKGAAFGPLSASTTTNTSRSNAKAISLNTEYNCSITSGGQYRYYKFTPSSSGTYSFMSTGSYDTYGYIYNSSGSQLAYNDNSGSGNNFSVSYSMSSGTTYYFAAKMKSTSTLGAFYVKLIKSDSTAPTISLSSTNDVASTQLVTMNFSDNNSLRKAYFGMSSTYTDNHSESLSGTSTTKTLSVESEGTYYFRAEDSAGNLSSQSSLTFYKTTFNANGGSCSVDTVLTKSGNSFTLPTPTKSGCFFKGWGTSSSSTSGSTGSYKPTATKTLYAVWGSENTSISRADNISLNTNVTCNITSGGQYRYYKFTPSSSGTYAFYSTGSYDTYGYIYNSSGSQLSSNDDGGSGYNFYVSYNLTSGTTYYFAACMLSSSTAGSFTVRLESMDSEAPSISLITTNTVTSSQSVTISATDDQELSRVYISSSNPDYSGYDSYDDYDYLSGKKGAAEFSIYSPGTYYFWAKDAAGKRSTVKSLTFYKTTLKANGGSCSTNTVLTCSNHSFSLPTATRTGYSFKGWSTSASSKSGSTGSYTPSQSQTLYAIWEVKAGSSTSNATNMTLDTAYTCDFGTSTTEKRYYKFTPSKTGIYLFYSTTGSGKADPYGILYDSDSKELNRNEDYDKSTDFKIYQNLVAGKTYYLTVGSLIGGSFTLKVSKHTCTYKNTSITRATTNKNGTIYMRCTGCGGTTSAAIAYPKSVKLSAKKYTYDGKAKKPTVKIKDANGKVIPSSCYSVKYDNGRKKVGRYAVKITFKGNYSGTVTKTFDIKPKSTKIKSISFPEKDAVKISWKKVSGISKYEVQFSTSKKFKANETKTLTVSSKKSSIKGGRGTKTYYVRVRAYKTVKFAGKKVKLYSKWSKAKSFK